MNTADDCALQCEGSLALGRPTSDACRPTSAEIAIIAQPSEAWAAHLVFAPSS